MLSYQNFRPIFIAEMVFRKIYHREFLFDVNSQFIKVEHLPRIKLWRIQNV